MKSSKEGPSSKVLRNVVGRAAVAVGAGVEAVARHLLSRLRWIFGARRKEVIVQS